MAVSGWLIGSTPTRLTIEVMVPSDSASTQAARCSRPRCGRPGSSTHPDAAPEHSGSDGIVSEGGCSISRPAAGGPRNAPVAPRIRRPRCLRPARGRRCRVAADPEAPREPRKWLWWRAIRVAMRRGPRRSAAGPTPWSSPATGRDHESPSAHPENEGGDFDRTPGTSFHLVLRDTSYLCDTTAGRFDQNAVTPTGTQDDTSARRWAIVGGRARRAVPRRAGRRPVPDQNRTISARMPSRTRAMTPRASRPPCRSGCTWRRTQPTATAAMPMACRTTAMPSERPDLRVQLPPQ